MEYGSSIIDPVTVNPRIIDEGPGVQGAAAADETKKANEETIKSEQSPQSSQKSELKE